MWLQPHNCCWTKRGYSRLRATRPSSRTRQDRRSLGGRSAHSADGKADMCASGSPVRTRAETQGRLAAPPFLLGISHPRPLLSRGRPFPAQARRGGFRVNHESGRGSLRRRLIVRLHHCGSSGASRRAMSLDNIRFFRTPFIGSEVVPDKQWE